MAAKAAITLTKKTTWNGLIALPKKPPISNITLKINESDNIQITAVDSLLAI